MFRSEMRDVSEYLQTIGDIVLYVPEYKRTNEIDFEKALAVDLPWTN